MVSGQNFVINPNSSVSLTADVFDQGAFVQNRENVNCLWMKDRRREAILLIVKQFVKYLLIKLTRRVLTWLSQTRQFTKDQLTLEENYHAPMLCLLGSTTRFTEGQITLLKRIETLFREVTSPHGGEFESGAPKRVFGIGLGSGQGIRPKQECDDVLDPNLLYKFNAECIVGESADADGDAPLSPLAEAEFKLKTEHYWPFNIVSGSIKSGYNARVDDEFKNNSIFANLHTDTIDITNEVPMQGPFTNQWVGGNQARHVDLNRHDTSLITEGGNS